MLEKAHTITFDLETYRTRDAEIVERIKREAIGKRPAKSAAKAVKAAWDIEENRSARAEEALAKTAVDVLLAEPLCFCGLANGEAFDVDLMRCESEKDALQDLVATLDGLAGPETVWVGHNIAGFDLPILLNRWRRYGIRPPEYFPVFINGRWRGRVFDTMKRVPAKTPFISLVNACRAYGLGAAKQTPWNGRPMDGSRVGKVFESGAFETILEYCAADVRVEHQLYLTLTAGETWGGYDRRSQVAEELAEIDDSPHGEGTKALAKIEVLEKAGLVPRLV